jgi:hypothetical protein
MIFGRFLMMRLDMNKLFAFSALTFFANEFGVAGRVN